MNDPVLLYLSLFWAGASWDALITIDLYATMEGRWLTAFITTFMLTVLSCTVYAGVFVVDGYQMDRVVALAMGSGFGAAALIRWRTRKTLRSKDPGAAQEKP